MLTTVMNNTDIALLNGYIGNFLGLDVIVDENYSDDQVLMLQRGIIGDIADAEPLKSHTYNQEEDSTTIFTSEPFHYCLHYRSKSSLPVKEHQSLIA